MIQPDHVARADKTAPMPESDKGDGIEGMNASGGGLTLPTVGNHGKGPPHAGTEASK